MTGEKTQDVTSAVERDVEAVREALRLLMTANYHEALGGCWATGPATGDAVRDLVACPGCAAIEAAQFLLGDASALSRLATAAARVPGLEQDVEGLTLEAQHQREARDTAESERDTALAQAREREEVNVEALLRAVTERNAARQEVEKKRARIIELQGDVAALDATPPADTHAQLAAVAEEVASAVRARLYQLGLSASLCVEAEKTAREVLRRATGGQVPEVLPKARVVEVLKRRGALDSPSTDDHEAGYEAAIRDIARDLDVTLDTPPSGSGQDTSSVPVAVGQRRTSADGADAATVTRHHRDGRFKVDCPTDMAAGRGWWTELALQTRWPRVVSDTPPSGPGGNPLASSDGSDETK